jgi:TonB family protein
MKVVAHLLFLSSFFSSSRAAQAQATYCPVYPMPELAGGGGRQAIGRAIQHRIAYPPRALRAGARGRVFVSFVVAPSGRVREVAVVKSFRPDCDSAVVAAVQQLPCFKARLARYGPVRYVAPITFDIAGTQPRLGPPKHRKWVRAVRKTMPRRNSTP